MWEWIKDTRGVTGRQPRRALRVVFVATFPFMLAAETSLAECTTSTPCASAPTNLGTLGADKSYALGVNRDGSVIVGESTIADALNNQPLHAFRRASHHQGLRSRMQDLGTLGGHVSWARGVNRDGSVVVGSSPISGTNEFHAVRWTIGRLLPLVWMHDLGTLGGAQSYAHGVSGDGSVVVGQSQFQSSPLVHAFRWTKAQGMVDLGIGDDSIASIAYGTNKDGSVVVGGKMMPGLPYIHAFRWTKAEGMVDLGTLPGGNNSSALGTNRDGSVVVGQSDTTSAPGSIHAFRWTKADGMVDLGTLGGPLSIASGTNRDGSVVVGCSSVANDTQHYDGFQIWACGPESWVPGPNIRAFRWTAATNMQDLNTLVSDAGVKMPAMTMVAATGVSDNGLIVGFGQTPMELTGYTAFRICVATTSRRACRLRRFLDCRCP